MGCFGNELDIGYCMVDLNKVSCKFKFVGVDCIGMLYCLNYYNYGVYLFIYMLFWK